MKRCSVCFADKPITEYYILNKSKDGRQNMCIPCHKIYYKNWTEARKEKPQSKFPQSKVCCDCHVEKPISQFGKRSASLDKKLPSCRQCWRIRAAKARKQARINRLQNA